MGCTLAPVGRPTMSASAPGCFSNFHTYGAGAIEFCALFVIGSSMKILCKSRLQLTTIWCQSAQANPSSSLRKCHIVFCDGPQKSHNNFGALLNTPHLIGVKVCYRVSNPAFLSYCRTWSTTTWPLSLLKCRVSSLWKERECIWQYKFLDEPLSFVKCKMTPLVIYKYNTLCLSWYLRSFLSFYGKRINRTNQLAG